MMSTIRTSSQDVTAGLNKKEILFNMKNSSADLDKIEDQSMQYETNVSPINSGPGLSSE